MTLSNLVERIDRKDAIVAIVGLGYVGLPLLIRYSSLGYNVIGVDVDQMKVDAINASQSYIDHIPSSDLSAHSDLISATTDFGETANADAIILCVPTPLSKNRDPDLSYVTSTMESVQPHLRAGQVVCLESTTYPGTTEDIIVKAIETRGLVPGEDVFVVYSPEREDPANAKFDTATIPKVVGGMTPNCLEAGKAFYSAAIDTVVPVSSLRVAEMTKLLENIHRAVNIGMINEMKRVADAMGIDIFEVVRAASTKPFGFTPYYPGPGIGGHCIPIDPFYLTWKAREYGMHTRFIELAGEINDAMPEFVVSKLGLALNEVEKSIKGSKVLVLGLAYKPNVDDVRESPSIHLLEILREKGANIHYSDPFVPEFPQMRSHEFDLKSVELTDENLQSFDAVILATDHAQFDYDQIEREARLIIDTRGRYQTLSSKIIRA
ncbi:MAG: nucleotide sugar dehydrogenase [Pikeienuella sp.]